MFSSGALFWEMAIYNDLVLLQSPFGKKQFKEYATY